MMAMCAAFGDTPGVNLEILIGQMVNLVRDGEPVRMSKRAGTVVTHGGPGRRRRRRRRPATRWPARRPTRTIDIDLDLLVAARRNENPVFYVQYAHARTVQRAAATPPTPGVRPRGRLRRRRCSTHETEAALLGVARASSRGSSRRPPSCASRTASPATSRSSPARTTGGTTSCRVRPAGRRGGHRPAPHPRCGSTTPPARCWPTASGLLGVSRAGADVSARARGRRPARRGQQRPAWLRAPQDVNALVRSLWAANVERGDDGALRVAGVDVRDARRGVRHPGLRRRRGRLPCSRARLPAAPSTTAFARSVRRRRRLLRRQGVPVHVAVARWVARGGPEPRRLHRRRARRRAAGRASRRAASALHGNNKSTRRDRARRSRRGVGRIIVDSFEEIERVAAGGDRGATASPPVMVRVTAGVEAHTHEYIATAHEDQKFGFSPGRWSGRRGGPAHPRRAGRPELELLGLHSPHRLARSSTVSGFEVAARRVLDLRAAGRRASTGSSCPRSTSAAASASPTLPGRPVALDPDLVGRGCAEIVGTDVPRRPAARRAAVLDRARAARSPARATFTLYRSAPSSRSLLDDGRVPHLRVRRRRHERQHPPGAVRRATTPARVAAGSVDAPPVLAASSASTARAATSSCTTSSLPADVAPGDLLAVAGTGAYGRVDGQPTTTTCRARRWWRSRDGQARRASSAARPRTTCSASTSTERTPAGGPAWAPCPGAAYGPDGGTPGVQQVDTGQDETCFRPGPRWRSERRP